jgi:hypothetical protein
LNGLAQRWVATREGFKPREVEEPIDYYWHRPLAGMLVQLVEHTSIKPNQLTFASAGAGVLSGVVLTLAAWVHPWWAVAGALLLLLSIVLDCADGQLARLRGISSPLGRTLDGCMDAVAPLFVFHGLAFILVAQGWGYAWVWPIGLATAGSLIWHASVYDVSKNIWLHATHPEFSLGGNTLLTPEDMERWKREFEDKGERFNALLMAVWARWTKPQLKALQPWLDESHTPRCDEERDLYDRPGGYSRILNAKAKGEPCPVCGTTIEKIQYLGGASYFCPKCQT